MYFDRQPMISVIMGSRYLKDDVFLLKRAVESILKQTFNDFEFIICDSGSNENARRYLERIRDNRVKIVRKVECTDLASKLNLCLKFSRGQYIARMDDDDCSYPDRLQKEILFLEKNRDVAYVGCNVALVQNCKKVGERILPERPQIEDFYITQPYIHPTIMFRTEVLKSVSGYCESSTCILCEDYDLLLRLYAVGYLGANLQEVLLDYTIPIQPKGNRKMRHRLNESITRYKRFKELGKLPKAFPYVIKPIAVGLLNDRTLSFIKSKAYYRRQ